MEMVVLILPENQHCLEELVSFAEELGFDSVRFRRLTNIPLLHLERRLKQRLGPNASPSAFHTHRLAGINRPRRLGVSAEEMS